MLANAPNQARLARTVDIEFFRYAFPISVPSGAPETVLTRDANMLGMREANGTGS